MANTGLGNKIRSLGLDILIEMPGIFLLDFSGRQVDVGSQR